MGNSSTSHLPSNVSCADVILSSDSVTTEYWDTASINPDFKIASIVMATILLLYVIIGVTSNVILIAFIISKHLKEPTHILLLNLAISDVLLCGLLIPFGIVSGYTGGFVFGSSDKMRCQVCQFGLVITVLSVASLNTLGVISVDRFVYFKYPISYHRYVTATKTVIVIILVWLFSALQSMLPLLGFGEIRYTHSICLCNVYLYGRTHITKNIYYVFLLLLLGLFPVITMLVTNVWIIIIVKVQIKKLYKIRKSFRNRNEWLNHQQSLRKEIRKNKNRNQLALLRTFGMILIANLVTWLPLALHSIASFIVDADDIPIGVYMFVFFSFISHFILHPIIQGCLIPELKARLKKTLFPCKKRDKATKKIDAEDDGSTGCCRRYLDLCSFAILSESQDMMGNYADKSFMSAGNRLDTELNTNIVNK